MDGVVSLIALLVKLTAIGVSLGFYAQYGQNGATDNTPKKIIAIRVHAVDGLTERNEFPEPWKTTTLLADHTRYKSNVVNATSAEHCWSIKRREIKGNKARPGLKVNEISNHCVKGNTLDFEFWYPGYYTVTVAVGNVSQSTQLRNLYARREIRDHTDAEWKKYVAAMWAVKNTNTDEGRLKFGQKCPSGKASDYHEHEYFIMLHAVMAYNKSSDQLHFSFMQEHAHQAWNTLLEKALQCVEPSVSLPYWNGIFEKEMYEGDQSNSSSLLASTVWSDKYYGSASNYEDDDGSNPHYWVKDGVFKDWWLAKTRNVSLCDEFPDTFPEFQERCRFTLKSEVLFRFTHNDGGWQLPQPGAKEMFQFVSRRPYYQYGVPATFDLMPSKKPLLDLIFDGQTNELYSLISGLIHSYGHVLISGRWNLQDPENAPVMDLSSALKLNDSLHYYTPINTRADLVKNLPWGKFIGNRQREYCFMRNAFDGCAKCTENGCTCITDNPACTDGNVDTPKDTEDAQDLKIGSHFRDFVASCRKYRSYTNSVYGCLKATHGTFDVSPVANQDPFFYPNHAMAFVAWDMAFMEMENNKAKIGAPYYGMESATRGEVDGHRLESVTAFIDLVPYKEGQADNSRHTWADIFDQWQFSKREYRWDYNTRHGFRDIGGFESILGNGHMHPKER